MDNCFTICQYKTQKPKIIEITNSISLEISLFWSEVDILSLRSKISALQTCNKRHGIKNVVKWDERLQLRRHSVVVITWLYPKTRMRISKALKKVYMLTFLYAGLFTTPKFTVIEWNELDSNLRVFEKKLFKFLRSSQNSVFDCRNCKEIKYLTRLCFGLSNLREHKFIILWIYFVCVALMLK